MHLSMIRFLTLICFLFLTAPSFAQEKQGGCQSIRVMKPRINISVVPSEAKLVKGIDGYRFPIRVEQDIKKWLDTNNIAVHWIPKKHRTGSRSMFSGLSYSLTSDRYMRNYDKGGNYRCFFFSDLNLELNFQTRFMMANSISDDECRFNHYLDYMEELNTINQNIVTNSFNALQEGEILNLLAYAEGDEYILYREDTVRNHEAKQNQALQDVMNAYLQATAQQAEDSLNAYDLSEAYETLQNNVEACSNPVSALQTEGVE